MIDLNFSSDNEEEVHVVDMASDKSTKKKSKDKQKEKKAKKAKNVVENVGDDSKVINVGRKDNLQLAKNTNTNTTLTSKNGNEKEEKEEKEQEQVGKQEKKKKRKRGNKKLLDQSNIGSNQKTITHNEEETISKKPGKKSPEKLLEKAALINHSTPLSITKENEEEEKKEKEEEKLVDTQEEAANESHQEAKHILIKNDENLQDETRKLKKRSKRNRNRTKANLLNAESKHPEKIDECKSLETCVNKSISCNKNFPKHKDGFVNKDVFTEDDMHPRRECENFSNEAKGASNKRREKLSDLVTKRTAPETNSCTSEDDNYAKLQKQDTAVDPIASSNEILSTQSKHKSKKARKLQDLCEEVTGSKDEHEMEFPMQLFPKSQDKNETVKELEMEKDTNIIESEKSPNVNRDTLLESKASRALKPIFKQPVQNDLYAQNSKPLRFGVRLNSISSNTLGKSVADKLPEIHPIRTIFGVSHRQILDCDISDVKIKTIMNASSVSKYSVIGRTFAAKYSETLFGDEELKRMFLELCISVALYESSGFKQTLSKNISLSEVLEKYDELKLDNTRTTITVSGKVSHSNNFDYSIFAYLGHILIWAISLQRESQMPVLCGDLPIDVSPGKVKSKIGGLHLWDRLYRDCQEMNSKRWKHIQKFRNSFPYEEDQFVVILRFMKISNIP